VRLAVPTGPTAVQASPPSKRGRARLVSAVRLAAPAGANAEIRVVIAATSLEGDQAVLTIDSIFFGSGGVESVITVMQVEGAPDSALEKKLTSQVAAKVARQ
jgi:hypothetical protein